MQVKTYYHHFLPQVALKAGKGAQKFNLKVPEHRKYPEIREAQKSLSS